MQNAASLQRARARTRARRKGEPQSPSNDNVVPLPAREEGAYAYDEIDEDAVFVDSALFADEPPFDPPAPEDLLGLGDVDPDEFVAANEASDAVEATLVEDLPPIELGAPHLPPLELDEEVPFDPPDEEDEIFQHFETPEPANDDTPERPKHALAAPRAPEAKTPDVPLPPIRLHMSWDSGDTAALYCAIAGDKRVAAAELSWSQGGLNAAIAHCRENESPDLIVIETKLAAAEILAGVDRLHAVTDAGVKILILGAVNDVTLLRGLAQRGVAEYVVTPAQPEALISSFCRLFELSDKSHTIAIVGARGGVGASTIAHNLAWSIAERQGAPTALLDLDLAFGTAAFDFNQTPAHSLSDALTAESLEEIAAQAAPRLRLLSAPLAVERALELEPDNVQALIARVRRQNAVVVLDLPHTWTPWLKTTLLAADSVVIVAAPDLASLRNTDNMLKVLRADTSRATPPLVALSMVGVPKRPEITLRDFSEAIAATPAATFPFDPALYATASLKGQMLGEAAPGAKAARMIDALASEITGREALDPKKLRAPQPLPELPRAELVLDAPVIEKDPTPAAVTEDSVAPLAEEQCKAPSEAVASATPERAADEALDAEAPPSEETPAPRAFGKLTASAIKPPAHEEPPALAPIVQRPVEAPTPVTHDRFAEARKAAEAELAAMERPRPKRSSGFVRIAASVAVLGGAVGYYAYQQRSAPANAAEPYVIARAAPTAAAAETSNIVDPAADRAAFQRALADLRGADAQAAVQTLRRLADRGIAPAQYRLAKLYERGELVAADLSAARQWTERAAAGGHVLAMHDLGVYFARGEGGGEDDASAFRWFRQAAEYGVADSQYNLGVFYSQGRSVTANEGEALFWFMVAADAGDESASDRAAVLAALLTPMDVAQARARADNFSARTPHPDANLGE